MPLVSNDARHKNQLASDWMHRGIDLLNENSASTLERALRCFDEAIALRQTLPVNENHHYRYGLSAGWINRGDALARLGGTELLAEAVKSYDEALVLLESLPLEENVLYPRRFAITWINRGMALQKQKGSGDMWEALECFREAVDVLVHPSALAEEATDRILKGHFGEAMSFRQAQHMIASDYMTQLKGAPFDPKDAALVPDAGPCAACPKRSGNQKELFADVGRADVCTDPVCFRLKCDAVRARLLAQAESEGKMVLSSEDAQSLYPHGNYLSHDAPVIELAKPCPFASGKTWHEVMADLPEAERPSVIVAVDRNGDLHELVGKKEAGEVARALDLATPGETRGDLSPAAVQQRQQNKDAREKHERTTRTVNLVIDAILAKQEKAKDLKALSRLLLMVALHEAHFDTCRRVNVRHGFTTVKKDGEPRRFYDKLAKAADKNPLAFALESLLWEGAMFSNDLPKTIVEAAKIYGLDLSKIKAEAKTKPAPAPKSEEAAPKK